MSIGRRHRIGNQRGVFIVIFALLLLVVLGFVALGIEGGRWYLVRAELAKAVDAAALEAAKNIGNNNVNVLTLAREVGFENFPAGYIGTPAAGAGAVRFTATQPTVSTVDVTGTVNATVVLAHLFGITSIPVTANAVAEQRNVEVMMVLDRSGSMAGQKMAALQAAALGFLSFFTPTQADDMLGLISFGFTVTVDSPMGHNFDAAMRTAINGMNAYGATNTEDALAQANGPQSFTNPVPGGTPVQQFVVFFSDGMPTAFRDSFTFNSTVNDGVVYGQKFRSTVPGSTANCRPLDYPDMQVSSELLRPTSTGNFPGVNPRLTGDGRPSGSSVCSGGNETTRWNIFQTRPVPRTGGGVYSADACYIPHDTATPPRIDDLLPYLCQTARDLALANAQTLKNRGIQIYVVGLGTSPAIDTDFLKNISSDCNNGTCVAPGNEHFTYITPNANGLQAIFNQIATNIRLKLVQ